MSEKIIPLKELQRFVWSGMVLAVGGGPLKITPMALLREVLRTGVHDLEVLVTPTGGLGVDMLIGSGVVRSVEFAQIVLEEFGMAPNFRRMVQSGQVACKDTSCPALLSGLQAAAMGIPFIPVRGFIGSDYLRVRKDFKVLKDPYSEEEILVVPPLAPDLALIHAIKGDRYGNLLLERTEDDQLLVKAAKRVIASVEEVVDTTELKQSTEGVFIPSLYIDAIVPLPYGAHPTDCRGHYALDETHLQEYLEAAQSPEGFQGYLEKYVYQTPDHEAYLERIGIKVAPV